MSNLQKETVTVTPHASCAVTDTEGKGKLNPHYKGLGKGEVGAAARIETGKGVGGTKRGKGNGHGAVGQNETGDWTKWGARGWQQGSK